MASRLVCLGRVAFYLLIIVQGILLASYPAKYEDNNYFYFFLVLIPGLPLGLWIYLLRKEKYMRWLFGVWLLYVIGLVILIGVIFGRTGTTEDKLNEEVSLCPNVLKITLCFSPVILLLLLSTGTDSMSYRELVWMLSLRIALDLFDGVEMLEVILEENKFCHGRVSKNVAVTNKSDEFCHGVSKDFEKAIIAFVCLSFLLSPLQLMEIKFSWLLGELKLQKVTSALRRALQIICVNFVFLVFRLVLLFEYSIAASIFVAKNSIIIVLSLFEICSTCGCCGCDEY